MLKFVVGLAILSIATFFLLLTLGACKLAGEADAQSEQWLARLRRQEEVDAEESL